MTAITFLLGWLDSILYNVLTTYAFGNCCYHHFQVC